LVSSIFDLAQGDATGHEEKQLGGLGSYETGLGEDLATSGAGFENSILSGDPSKIGQALAPEISSGQEQVQEQALQNANFGNRSGGTNASTQAATGAERGNIINLVGGLQSGTAGQAVGQGAGLMGQASQSIGQEAQLAAANQQRVTGDVSGIAQSAAAIAAGFGGGEPDATTQPWAPDASKQAGNAFSLATDDELGPDPLGQY
jgi:hypothetical protein